MDDATAILAGHTEKYKIPLSHFEHKYIQNCTDGKELERIYKELIGGELGQFKELENLTLDRIRDVKPNSQILRQDKAPLDKSALPDDERRQFDDFLDQMRENTSTSSIVAKDHQNNGIDSVPIRSKSIVSNSITPTSPVPVINKNGKPKRIVPRSYDEWGKLDQKLSRESNSDADDEDKDEEDNHTENEKSTNKSRPSDPIPEKSQRLRMAEQHRLNGNTAFKVNNYQQSIDSYTKSVMLDKTNPVVYMNRAIAHFKLNNYDASITDCSQVLSSDPYHIKALYRRASCRIAKQQYDEAKRDLDVLLTVDRENDDAKNLLETIPKAKGVRIPIMEDDGDEEEEVHNQPMTSAPLKIPITEVEEEEEENEPELEQQMPNGSIQSMSIDIPSRPNLHTRPCIDSQEASPAMFDPHFHHRDDPNQFPPNMDSHLSPLHSRVDNDDDDDDMALGDEADAGLLGNMSDDDENISHSLNVSPTMDDGDDDGAPELVDHKPLQTPPLTPTNRQTSNSNTIYQPITTRTNENYRREDFSSIPNDDSYDHHNIPTISNNYSSIRSNSIEQQSSTINSSNDQIANSNFSSIIQKWLRDLVASQSNRRSSSFPEKPWSKSMRPYALDRLQRDIEKFQRLNDFRNAVEASKKMLKNGALDYHKHAEHIVNTLTICAQCYSKSNDHIRTIQYASEALQYNKTDTTALICRAKAFENDKFLSFSYADYARIPANDLNYPSAKKACEKLSVELNKTEGINWQEKLPKDNNDDEQYLTHIKIKDQYSETDPYTWYRNRGNQLYLDGCFVLAIRCFTHCIQVKSDIAFPYTSRAACYLKVFEPQKTVDDCDKALAFDPTNVRALYRKACAYKMLSNDSLYRITLKSLLEIQPNNQTILSEYYSSQHEQVPRKMRRLRANPIDTTNTTSISSSSSEMKNSQSTMINEENNLSYEDLEQIRAKKVQAFSVNTKYQFTQQLDTLKSDDIKGACALILRLPTKGLFKIVSGVSPKLIETIVIASRTMIYAEKRYQQNHKSSILPFSYVTFCYNILIELTTIPRLDSALAMIDQNCRASLDDLLSYSSSISTILNDVDKLNRLRK